jgi:hypothetical protein
MHAYVSGSYSKGKRSRSGGMDAVKNKEKMELEDDHFASVLGP